MSDSTAPRSFGALGNGNACGMTRYQPDTGIPRKCHDQRGTILRPMWTARESGWAMIMIVFAAGIPAAALINALGVLALPLAGLIIWTVYRHRTRASRRQPSMTLRSKLTAIVVLFLAALGIAAELVGLVTR